MKIFVGDITTLKCDAIVNAANQSLLGGGGVDGAIHRAAGPKLVEECRTLHGCQTGDAKITLGYNLPAKHVIHTVGPVYSGDNTDPIKLASCYTRSLEVAKENDLHSIAFSAVSTGVYGYPLKAATVVAVKAVRSWLEANPDYEIDVIFCCFSQNAANVYQEVLNS